MARQEVESGDARNDIVHDAIRELDRLRLLSPGAEFQDVGNGAVGFGQAAQAFSDIRLTDALVCGSRSMSRTFLP